MLVPKLRFKRDDGSEFPEWKKRTLGEVGVFIRGLSYGKDSVTSNQTATLVLRSNNISEDKTLNYNSDLQFVEKKPKAEQVLIKNDIVICMANGSNRLVGKAAQYDGKYYQTITVGAFCGIFRCSLPIIRYIFQSPDYTAFLLLNLQGGDGAIANLKGDDILSFTTCFPCLEEQQKIADFLSAVDEVIAQSQAEVQNLEQQKKAAMQKIFSQEVRFKRDDGTNYPEWEEKKLSYCFEPRDTKQVPTDEAPLMAFIAYQGVADKGERYDRSYLVKTEDKKYKRTEYNDFIYSSNNLDVGSIGLNKYGTAVISVVYEIFRVRETAIPDFINALVQMPENMYKIIQFRQGCLYGQYKIFADDFLSVKAAIPCIEEQQKIADFLSAYDEAITYAKQELEQWKQLKKGLLQQMFV